MAINDYASLQAATSDWLRRADLDAVIPTFIQLAEDRLNRTLRVREMLVKTTGTDTGTGITLPTDLAQIFSMRTNVNGQWMEVPPMPPEAIAEFANLTTPVPGVVVQESNKTGIYNVQYEITYYQNIPSLSPSNTQNWLILKHPQLYLYATLCESAPYLKDDARVALWDKKVTDILNEMRIADDYARYGNAPRAYMNTRTP